MGPGSLSGCDMAATILHVLSSFLPTLPFSSASFMPPTIMLSSVLSKVLASFVSVTGGTRVFNSINSGCDTFAALISRN